MTFTKNRHGLTGRFVSSPTPTGSSIYTNVTTHTGFAILKWNPWLLLRWPTSPGLKVNWKTWGNFITTNRLFSLCYQFYKFLCWESRVEICQNLKLCFSGCCLCGFFEPAGNWPESSWRGKIRGWVDRAPVKTRRDIHQAGLERKSTLQKWWRENYHSYCSSQRRKHMNSLQRIWVSGCFGHPRQVTKPTRQTSKVGPHRKRRKKLRKCFVLNMSSLTEVLFQRTTSWQCSFLPAWR